VFVRLVFDKFERAGANRMAAHVALRDMARVDRRLARGEQRGQVRLRPLQVEGDLVIAIGGDLKAVGPDRPKR
jgi:hypothetical protein